MDEGRRRRYLQALGIDAWVRRGGGPGAPEPAPTLAAETGAEREEAVAPARDLADGGGGVETLDLDQLRARVAGCTACALHEGRTQTVFGVGDPHADLMVIGEAPGAQEDRQGEPFVGRAGMLLNEMLRAIGRERGDVYITNIVKCRPPENRDPTPDEADACAGYLRRQMEVIAPRVIFAIGRVAAQNLLQSQANLGRLRGRVHEFGPDAIPLVVSYHPAYLLRSPQEKRKAWADLKLVLSCLDEADA